MQSKEIKTFILKSADDKLTKILQRVSNFKLPNLLKITHKWCANMRSGKGSKSLSTAAIPLKTKQKKNKMFLPISVCCATDYCKILQKKSVFYYKYHKQSDLYFLYKSNKIVQITKGFKTEKECRDFILQNSYEKSKTKGMFFPFIKLSTIKQQICS